MNNHDRIKNMSIEEMAKAISEHTNIDPCDLCPFDTCIDGECDGVDDCEDKYSETDIFELWLQKEVTNDMAR